LCTYFIFLILHLTTILKINYIFLIILTQISMKIKKCEHTSTTTYVFLLVFNKVDKVRAEVTFSFQ